MRKLAAVAAGFAAAVFLSCRGLWVLALLLPLPALLKREDRWRRCALVAAFLDMRLRKAMPAIFAGVLIAGFLITGITYGFTSIF